MKTYRMASFNLRLDLEIDGRHRWQHRLPHVLSFLKRRRHDIIGFQEVTPNMYETLKEELKGYDYVGDYRYYLDEATPVFYRKDKLTLLEDKTFWLSDTPDEISIYEGSFFYRICTYGIFQTKTGVIAFFNTHLDYHTDDLSLKQLKVILKVIDDVRTRYPQAGIVLCGDFNQPPGSRTVEYASSKLIKTFDEAQPTYHGFGKSDPGVLLDYCFYDRIPYVKLDRVTKQPKGTYLSDHYPLELTIKQ
ncbi:MAG: endonuclease/exonuclease/phosphatase family protein [Acholeplasmataceae bacterium]|nr:MAG: endonuclease/exonuclease/phosphatase family protein [Acholeplasmataceae bacterium]